MKILYLNNDGCCDYDSCNHTDNDIALADVQCLTDEVLLQLFNEILGILNHPGRKIAKNTAVNAIKHYINLISPGEAKVLDGLKVKGNSFLFPLGGFGYEKIEIGKDADIDDYTIEKIVKMPAETSCYIQVEIPKNIQDKIDAYKVKLEKDKKIKERKKKERELENAKRIIKEAGGNI